MSKNKTLFVNSLTSIVSKVLSALIQLVCLPILIKVYGKGDYGLIAIAMSLNTFIAILQIGLPTGIPKFVAEWFAKGQRQVMVEATQTVFSFYLILALLNLILILAIRIWGIGYFVISPDQVVTLKSLLIVTAVASFISIPANYIDQLLSGVQEIAFVSRLQIVKNIIFAGLVSFVFFNPEKLSVVGFYTIRCVIMFCMIPATLSRWRRYSSFKSFIPGWNYKAIIPLLKYCLSLMTIAVFILLAEKLRPLIMTVRVSDDAAGNMTDFEIINNVRMFLVMISSSFLAALVPYVSHELATGRVSVCKKVIQDATKPVWAFSALIGFGIMLLSKEILTIYVGSENTYLQKWLILLIAATMCYLYTPCISSVILSSGRTRPLAVVTASGCVVSLLVCWFLSPITALGSIVIAHAVYICIVFFGTHLYYLPKCFGVAPGEQIMKILLPPVVSGLIMLLTVRSLLNWLAFSSSYVTILLGAIAGTIVYSAVILTIYIRPGEVRQLITKVRKSGP